MNVSQNKSWITFVVLAAAMVVARHSPANASENVAVLPIDTTTHRAEWESTVPIRRVVDEPTGHLAAEYREFQPQNAEMWTEFDHVDLDQYDALRFRWKMTGDRAWPMVTIEGYPEGRTRNYYLRKRPNPMGQWQEVWLDLAMDDDGLRFRREVPEGKLRLRFKLFQWDRGDLPEIPNITFRVDNIRFVRYPVRIEGDMQKVETFEEDGRIGQRYPFTLHNRTDRPLEATLLLDQHALREFTIDLPEPTVTLQPDERREIVLSISMPSERAAGLPPLYNEQAQVFVGVGDDPESVAPWNAGYMLMPVVGALPVADTDYPRLFTDTERRLAMQRTADGDRIAANIIQRAEGHLDLPPEPPDLRHGYSGHNVDPENNATLRFRGPGRVWSEGSRDYIDIESMPPAVRKAIDYAHHNYLTGAAQTLGQAWWLTGREEFARKTADILLAYADRYPDYDTSRWYENQLGWRGETGTVADGHDGAGRRLYSSGYLSRIGHANLGDAWWFDGIPVAVDLVLASGVLDASERDHVVRNLLVPAMLNQRAHRSWANQQAEYNYTYGTAALVAGHWPLAAEALDGEAGMRSQWETDFDADGWGDENDMPYHFVSLGAFTKMATQYEAAGVPVFDERFKRLFDAPLAYAIDQSPGRYPIYLRGYIQYRDPAYLHLARRAGGLARLTMPIEELPDPGEMRYTNSQLPTGGFTVLRSGCPDTGLRAISMNWGMQSHRGGRVMLNPKIIWKNHNLNRHIGRIAYGYDNHGFSYRAAAGNAIIADGHRHAMRRADQVAVLDGDTPAGRWHTPRHRSQYPGLAWSRTAAILGDTYLIIDQLDGDTPRRLDLLTYLPADFDAPADLEWTAYPALNEQGDGYEFFSQPRRADRVVAMLEYKLPRGGATGRIDMLGTANHLITAIAPAGWHPVDIPAVIRRVEEGRQAWFATAYTGIEEGADTAPEIVRMAVERDGRALPPEEAVALRVNGRYLVLTSLHDGEHRVDHHLLQGPLAILAIEKE